MRASRDAGAATPLVLGAVAVVLVATTASLTLVGAVVGSHRARAAADLAALAGAQARVLGSPPAAACTEAGRVARANGASLRECASRGGDLVVLVAVDVRGWPRDAVARSRAGVRDAAPGPP